MGTDQLPEVPDAEANRLQKTLEGANIKLASVISYVTGKSGRAILSALVAGITDPKALAAKADSRLQQKQEQLEQALQGVISKHQRQLLSIQLRHIDLLNQEIKDLDQEIEQRMRPFEDALDRLDTIPGIGPSTAQEIVAAIGADMSRFPTAAHLASWAGMCPGNNESTGKRKSGKTRKGNPTLRTALVDAAWAAARTKGTYLSAQYHRLAARWGRTRAAIAVGHSILTIAYHIPKDGSSYNDLGPNYFDERDKQRTIRRTVKRLEKLGYKVRLSQQLKYIIWHSLQPLVFHSSVVH